MKKLLLLAFILAASLEIAAQSFELVGLNDTYKGLVGETIRSPLYFKNTSQRSIILIIRKADSQIGTSQKNYFSIDGRALDPLVEDYIVKIEPGKTLTSFQVVLEAGLVPGISSIRYVVYNKSNPNDALEFDLHFTVDEKSPKDNIYDSRSITIQDVYPNPAYDHAYAEYRVLSDQIKAKIVLHNILGNAVGEYHLSPLESRVKLHMEDLNSGIYFYTLYIDNEAVMTRKLVVRK